MLDGEKRAFDAGALLVIIVMVLMVVYTYLGYKLALCLIYLYDHLAWVP